MNLSSAAPLVLAIESSCDETAVALVDATGRVLGNALYSQFDEHRAFGGVVPEIAARAHSQRLPALLDACLDQASVTLAAVDAFAATAGPGLIGGLLAGSQVAWGLARARGKPYLAINHLEGHALTARLTCRQGGRPDSRPLAFPYLLLLISGGHCQILLVAGVGHYQLWGSTIDDAAGEAFDKVAKMLDLGYPGGPAIERAARAGDAAVFALPVPMAQRANCDFSFSGLKTAVRRQIELAGGRAAMQDQQIADLAASFQQAVCRSLADRVARALARWRQETLASGGAQPDHDRPVLAVAGGVAANQAIAAALAEQTDAAGVELLVAPLALCSDNAVMIAWAAQERLAAGITQPFLPARPRWPLAELATLPNADPPPT